MKWRRNISKLKIFESFEKNQQKYNWLCGKIFLMITREFTLEKNLTSVHSVTRFNRSGNLKAHERIHTGEKLHTCDQCGRSFTQAYGLKHLHSHSGEICYG